MSYNYEPNVIVYSMDETDFNNNGKYILDNIIMDDVVQWGLFDQWSLSFRIPVVNELGATIESGQIIKAPTPNFKEPQLFYVVDIVRTLADITVTAIHIHNKVKHIYLPSTLIQGKDVVDAGKQILLRGTGAMSFDMHLDPSIAAVKSVNTEYIRVNALQAIADETMINSLVSLSLTEFTANNFDLYLMRRIGEDRGIDLRFGRDLLSFSETIDTSEMVGRVLPVGKDGYTIPESEGGPYISLDDVDEIDLNYNPSLHHTQDIEYDHIVARYGENADDDEALHVQEAIRQLKRLGEREFTLRQVHHPTLSYEVDFAEMKYYATSKAQQDMLKDLQTIYAGDTVTVIDYDGTSIKERMVGYTYKPSTQEYLSMTLANRLPEITAEDRAKKRALGGGFN